jgi:predicted phage gp36 major capsid-like protein
LRERLAAAKAAHQDLSQQAQRWREQALQREQAEINQQIQDMTAKLKRMAELSRSAPISNVAGAFVSSISRTGPPLRTLTLTFAPDSV